MAKSNPRIPLVNIITQDPITGYIIDGEISGSPSALYAGSAYAGIFALECTLRDADGTGIWQMTGTVAVPAWSLIENAGDQPLDSLAYNLVSTAGAALLTAAQMVYAWLDRDGGATNRVDTTPTAAQLLAGLPGAIVGSTFDFVFRNVSTTPGQFSTLTAGANVTISGNAQILAGAAQHYKARVTSITGAGAITLYAVDGLAGALAEVITASNVNSLRTTTAATTDAPEVSAVGTDTDIGIKITPKGAGVLSNAKGTVLAKAANFIATEGGANNAITGALLDADGVAVPLAAGLEVSVLLAHSLQAGGNTFVLNGAGGTKAIKSHNNPANDIGTAYVSGGIIKMMYDGTQWQDMSQ